MCETNICLREDADTVTSLVEVKWRGLWNGEEREMTWIVEL